MISTRRRPLVLGALLLNGLGVSRPRAISARHLHPDIRTQQDDAWSMATAINNRGQIVGWSGAPYGGPNRAVLWHDGQAADLGTLPGGTGSEAFDINDGGQIVGRCDCRAALWQDEQVIDLAAPSDAESYAWAINSSGQIVGRAAYHAVLWEDGEMVELGGLPGDKRSGAADINDAGQIVGWSETANHERRAVLWQDGQINELASLTGLGSPSRGSHAWAINRDGLVVGQSETASGDVHAVMWRDGEITELANLLGHGWSEALSINDVGQIVGASAPSWGTPGDLGGGQTAVLWDGETVTELGSLSDASGSSARAINTAGRIAGRSMAPYPIYGFRAVLWVDGQIVELGTLPAADEGFATPLAGGVA